MPSPAFAPASALAIDPRRCPLCGQMNECAMERERASGEKQSPCWCTQVDFNRTVLEKIPAPARRLACVCRACATAHPLSLSNQE
jgi:hypothetical protein